MVVPLQPIKAVPCNIEGCFQSFDDEKAMKRHKRDDPTHSYCKKCDVDCEDWESLVEHKVEGMAPWVECRADRRPEGNPPHIVCEFCGEDFKSMGGRLQHREHRHQATQSILCPGCHKIFGRAGDMIAHLEDDECEAIRDYEFYAHMQHKYMKKEIMKNLDYFIEALRINANLASPPTHPGLIEAEQSMDRTDTETDGGVLLDQDHNEQKGGIEPLEAKLAAVKLGGKKVPLTRSNLEAWPRLPGQMQSVVPDHILDQSIGSPPPSIISMDVPASEFASQITSRRGGVKAQTESYPYLRRNATNSESKKSGRLTGIDDDDDDDDDDDAESVSTAQVEAVLKLPAAWTTTQTSRALFGDIKAEKEPEQVKSILKHNREEDMKAPKNLLNARWWDPESDDYNPEVFFYSVFERYKCPFPECKDMPTFDHPHDIASHLLDAHGKTKFRCPGCLKLFRRASGMVSHMESTQKCPIRKSKNFKSVLDEVTGGFIKAKRLPQPTIYRSSTAVVKSGQVVNGVMSTMYKAGWPNK